LIFDITFTFNMFYLSVGSNMTIHCNHYFADSADSEKAKSPTSSDKMRQAIKNMEKLAQTVKQESLAGNLPFLLFSCLIVFQS
jgi:hypothetical protein